MHVKTALKEALRKAAYAKETQNYEMLNMAKRFIRDNYRHRHTDLMFIIE